MKKISGALQQIAGQSEKSPTTYVTRGRKEGGQSSKASSRIRFQPTRLSSLHSISFSVLPDLTRTSAKLDRDLTAIRQTPGTANGRQKDEMKRDEQAKEEGREETCCANSPSERIFNLLGSLSSFESNGSESRGRFFDILMQGDKQPDTEKKAEKTK